MELITEKEAAELLKVSTKTVSRLRAAGEIPFIRGRPIRIRLKDLLEYIERTVTCFPNTSRAQNLSAMLPESSKSAIQKKRAATTDREFSLAGRLAAMRPNRSSRAG
jgi:excisionase family DNA binding protein